MLWFSFGGCVFVVVFLVAVKWRREMAEKTTWGFLNMSTVGNCLTGMWQLATFTESVLKQQNSFILTGCNETALSDCQKEQNALNPALFKML